MRNFSKIQKVAGEEAVKKLSKKAKENLWETDLLSVYEYSEDGENKYACAGAFAKEGLTLQELEETLENMVVTYHLIDVAVHKYDTRDELKHYTFEELKNVYDPRKSLDAEDFDVETFDEICCRWAEIDDLSSLEDYLEWWYEGNAVPYKFKEDLVENIKEKERINRRFFD